MAELSTGQLSRPRAPSPWLSSSSTGQGPASLAVPRAGRHAVGGVLGSGVHATFAGAVLGLCIPARPSREPADALVQEAESALDRLVSALHPWVAFLVVPAFALVNAGVTLPPSGKLVTRVSLGVAAGLFLGKQAGIFVATLVAVKVGWSQLPQHSTWRQLYGVAVLGGIGFTMSLFVGALAFGQQAALEAQAKIGILAGSLMSATAGLLLLRFSRPAGEPKS